MGHTVALLNHSSLKQAWDLCYGLGDKEAEIEPQTISIASLLAFHS